MTRTLAALAALALVVTTTLHATAQTPAPAAPKAAACTPEHAKMGHCKMDNAAPAMDHFKMGHGATPAASGDTASTKAFKAANDTMHAGMNIPFTGNADVDFVKGMIPHHQAAIDMAKVQLEYGKDPEIRKLAEGIIAAQTAEIAQMNDWLAAHPAK